MIPINRQVAVIKPKEPYTDWVNSLLGVEDRVQISGLNNDCTAILLPHFDDEEQTMKYIKTIYRRLFETELFSWCTDKSKWPRKISYAIFCDWFLIEIHSEVYDCGKGSIVAEEF